MMHTNQDDVPMPEDVARLVRRYRDLLVRWPEEGLGAARPEVAGILLHRSYDIRDVLRQSEEGRRAIGALMRDDVEAVRLAAATDVLEWDPVAAEPVLEEIATGGRLALTAEVTLQLFRDGEFDVD
ncbi:hypothetical protein DCE93_09170 [Agromyces badenianii]|uniref:DUF2019 domain-containing protein n=2 Tax=Agromyces badenianii TaxID=2080742 RepID=A0A2S0WWX7_9MICO|nr:hypothetical protein DCE93_09170 [Agromyces badenianii]